MDVVMTRGGGRRHRMSGLVWLAAAGMLLLSGCWLDAPAAADRQQESLQRMRAESAFSDPKARELAVAAALGDAATIRRLMRDEGVDPDLIFGGRDGGMPLLAWPVYARNPEGLRAMLENGADPNAAKPYPRREGFTPTNHSNAMVWASEQEDQTYLNLLLDHGGDPDTRNANNEALLFHAFIKQNKWRNVQLLVERGADVNASVGMGGTILGHYASNGGFMMTHWLLEHGADPTLDYAFGKPVHAPDSHTIEAVFWHPGNPDDPTWQRRCQQWLLAHGHARPPMPEHYRLMRERLGFPHREEDIPLL
jgi:uncharacterized protein